MSKQFEEDRMYSKEAIEPIVRKRFKHIIEGEGFVIPRIAVKVALDDLFNLEAPRNGDRK